MIHRNENWISQKTKVKKLLANDEYKVLMKKRSTECETVFDQTKGNLGFRRFHLRGKEKVGTEWGLLMLGYDFKQLIRLINKHRLVGPEKDNLNNFINIFIAGRNVNILSIDI
ncbi:MAG: transposase [Treponema sp.]|nr:transposase [Treponema sp.]